MQKVKMSKERREYLKQRQQREKQRDDAIAANTERVNKVIRKIGRLLSKQGWKPNYVKNVPARHLWNKEKTRLEINFVTHKQFKFQVPIYVEYIDVMQSYPVDKVKNQCRMRYQKGHPYIPGRTKTHSLVESPSGFNAQFIADGILDGLAGALESHKKRRQEQKNQMLSSRIAKRLRLKKDLKALTIRSNDYSATTVSISVNLSVTEKQAKKLLPILRKEIRAIQKENKEAK